MLFSDERWRFAVVDRTQSNLQFFKQQETFHAADAKAVSVVRSVLINYKILSKNKKKTRNTFCGMRYLSHCHAT